MPTTLDSRKKAILRNASRKGTVLSLSEIRTFLGRDRFLGKNNKYSQDVVEALRMKNGYPKLNDRHMRQYIASSGILHVVDGWRYLAGAIQAELQGGHGVAQHLGYYAELRAALGLLASEGRGVFGRRHVIIQEDQTCKYVKPPGPGTHEMAWQSLDHWAGLRAAHSLVGSIIKPGGFELTEWFENLSKVGSTVGGASSSLTPISSSWLRQWGMDLASFNRDRDHRNILSYRPSDLVLQPEPSIHRWADFVEEFWSLNDPQGTTRFEQMDWHLLRISLETAMDSLELDEQQQVRAIEGLLRNMGYTGTMKDHWLNFLIRQISPEDPELLSLAYKNVKSSEAQDSRSTIARATLLLRLATGSASALISEAGLTRSELNFWLNDVGSSVGLWADGSMPLDLIDLWADIEYALEDLEDIRDSQLLHTKSDLRGANSNPGFILSSAELAGLWGLSL